MNLNDLKISLDSLRGANLRAHSSESLEKRVAEVFSEFPRLGITRNHAQLWYRVRPSPTPEGFASLHECIYPPTALVRDFGRANYPGHPTFYAAWNIVTALAETRPEIGQFVQIIVARPRRGLDFPFHIVGEIEHLYHAGRSLVDAPPHYHTRVDKTRFEWPEDVSKANALLDGFMAEQYSHPEDARYRLTAAYAKPVFENGRGVMYPSVQLRGGMNAAISAAAFDEKFEIVWTEVLHVTNYYSYGVYDLGSRHFSCDFAEDGTILWDSQKRFDVQWSARGGFQILEEIEGWRVRK